MTTSNRTPFEERLAKEQWRRSFALRGYERNTVTPTLAEALRAEIRTALEADGKPFDVNIAKRVYDLAMAARDMCIAASGDSVKEVIDQIKDTDGPMESLDVPGTPESQMQVSETFGARIIREMLALFPKLAGQAPRSAEDPAMSVALVHALATARERGMVDVAEQLEIKLFGRALPKACNLPDGVEVVVGGYEHGFADGQAGHDRAHETPAYVEGYVDGIDSVEHNRANGESP